MARERPKSPRARLFVALDLPEELRSEIADWGSTELDDPALRPVPRESLHITLAFLGSRPKGEIGQLSEIVGEIEGARPTVRLEGPIAKPSSRRPRLFALPAASPTAIAMQSELAEKLAAQRLYKPEKPPFWPHVTVARVKSEGDGSKRPSQVLKQPGKLSQALLQPTSCVRVTLYRSELQPLGAQYIPLAQVELSEDGRQ